MIVSVTALGSRAGNAAAAVARVLDYLDGRTPQAAGRSPKWWDDRELGNKAPGEHGLGPLGDGVLGYYADSVEGAGTWLGRGLAGFSPTGEVARDELARMLSGQDPASGRQLLDGRGSATRADHLGRGSATVSPRGPDDELLTIPQAASLLGVSAQYLRKVVADTASRREVEAPVPGGSLPVLDHPYLDAGQAGPHGHWSVTRGEVSRFAEVRRAPTAVIGYDLTFSVPKSVSLLWARAEGPRQDAIVAAVQDAVAAGVAYLQENAAFVRSGSSTQRADGLLAASYLHGTSRALDPQLHAHVVVANMAERSDGAVRALDGRPLFAHAKTASYLAGAELRHQLTRRLGVEWEQAERGLADVAGVPRAAIVEMSKRSAQLDAVLPELEAFYASGNGLGARGRQVAAYITRAAKDDHGVDPEALRPWWGSQLDSVGFGARAVERCYDRQAAPSLVTQEQRRALFAHLASPGGVTEMAATFGRRDVIQHIADWAGDRLPAGQVCDLADTWLASDVVVRLEVARRCDGRSADVVRLRDGRRVNALSSEPAFTTQAMLGVEERLFATYERGRHAGAGVVPTAQLDAVLAARPELGEDQVSMVRSICTSGHRLQCVLGPAGSGKTFALAAAARAWEDAGYHPIGAVVQGTATEVLRDATAMDCSTVASLVYRLDQGFTTLDDRSVVVVDESSTLANRDLARLAGHVERAGAALRLIGDPAQHSAVAAGGGWRALLERYPQDRAELTERRRQMAPEMTEVRLASVDYAAGRISEAVERLRRDDRVVEADSPEELLDALAADWYVDRLQRCANPGVARSSMTADHHFERRELNARARALLAGDGTLTGPVVEVAGQCFQAGDEVVAMEQDRRLRARPGRDPDFVRNGERGRVVEARPGRHPVVVVDFERRGQVEVGEAHLTKRVRPGVVGQLAHAYAVTSNMAQGETYQAGRHLTSDASSRQGVYVGLTRGRSDARLYLVRRRDMVASVDQHGGLPRLDDQATTVEAVTRRLESQRGERLAQELDPDALGVARLQRCGDLAQLAGLALASDDPAASLAGRAYRQAAEALASAACLDVDPCLAARLGPRPDGGPERRTWDRAVGAVAVYRARWGTTSELSGSGGAWALGPPPASRGALAQYQRSAELLDAAERSALANTPTAGLAQEHRSLRRTLAGAPGTAQRSQADAASTSAQRDLAQAEGERIRAAERLEQLEGARRWHRYPQGIEMARQSLRRADQHCARAAVEVQRAEATVAAIGQHSPGLDLLRQRLEAVDAALSQQVNRALAAPAPYLTSALGHPSAHTAESDGPWHEAATRIEIYRHRQLGRAPADGPVVDEGGLLAAIGPRPDDYLAALQWDHVAEAAAPDLAPARVPEGLDLAP